MIIDISQTETSVIVSYVKDGGSVGLKIFNVNDISNGFFEFVTCDKSDPDVMENLNGYKLSNDHVKKIWSHKFNPVTLRYFLTILIPEEDQKEIFEYREATPYACDIELDLSSDESRAFPDANEAEFPICTIQITAPNLDTVILTTNRDRIREGDEGIVEDMVNNHFKDCENVNNITERIHLRYIVFDTEKELIEYYFKKVKEVLHLTIWYNNWKFDNPYVEGRCKKLGINPSVGSPTLEYNRRKQYPKHRLVVDFMEVAQKYGWDLLPRPSWSLDSVSQKINGVGKVKYEGTFKEMYTGDVNDPNRDIGNDERVGAYNFFQFYGAVDTILLQLMYQNRDYYSTIMSLSFVGKIGLYDAWATTKVSEALIFDELYLDNKINCYPYIKQDKEEFEGGFVKDPTKLEVSYPTCFDFKSLYSFVYISTNISFENFIKKAESKEEAREYLAKGYFVSVDMNIYKNDKDYTMRKVQKKLYAMRDAYKSMEFDLFQNIETSIGEELERRGIKTNY